jgi:hypothetical protein
MFGSLATVIVDHMDIGKTIRCYTVEPLRDPVPAPREFSVRVPDRETGDDRHELDPVSDRAMLPGDSALEHVLAPAVLRRISG